MPWHARLNLHYQLEAQRCVARFEHEGPLRVLQTLYPEGPQRCHTVLVHPPGGLVGGDEIDITVEVAPGAHGLVTTPGATRFYRSTGEWARQRVQARLGEGARLEWLPLETLAYDACLGENISRFELAPTAELFTWDVLALGLPLAEQPFLRGVYRQHLELPGVWLERGELQAQDQALMDGPVGLAGHRCLATLVFARGEALTADRAQTALDSARALIEASPLRLLAGVTQAHPQVLVVRALADVTEPAVQLLKAIWAQWRQALWQLPAETPRLWNL